MALPTRVSQLSIDPFGGVREMDGVLNRLFGDQINGEAHWAPFAVDVREDADHFYVEADMPGFKKEEIDITLEKQTLTIVAERKQESQGTAGDYLLNERRHAKFQRSFKLPPTVDERHVDAKLADGVLHVTLNKREESKPRKITVQ